ncbi:hypothetical protein MtrunA17_Chr4g0019721 [Medicago truncatula]|uniref:Uncharacterized protein n=1 Tax=Medicago truncatula TaxID=3880 RepID=A0A396IAT3_MEDTR|nr:hypothetical protein MtrunA17_Chr4g0019721 [Medicago truncatula]
MDWMNIMVDGLNEYGFDGSDCHPLLLILYDATLVRRCFVRRRCATLFVFLVSFRYLLDSDCQISFDPVQIKSMTLESSTLQIRSHVYSRDLNIVICVGFSTLPFYAINMDAVSLFTDSSSLFLANFHCIDVLYQFE